MNIVRKAARATFDAILNTFARGPKPYLLLACLAATLLLNTYLYTSKQSPAAIRAEALASVLLCYSFVLLCCKYRVLLYTLFPAWLVLASFIVYLKWHYNARLDIGIVASILETNWKEALSYCTPLTAGGALLLLAAIAFLAAMCRRFVWKSVTWGNIIIAGISYSVLDYATLVCSDRLYQPPPSFRRFVRTYISTKIKNWPASDILGLAEKLRDYRVFKQIGACGSCADAPSTCTAPDDLLIVFHMGESLRSDHLSLNGYHRPTTPFLAKAGNLISFPRTTSFGTVTCFSVHGIFSDAELEERRIRYRTFVDLFNKHRFMVTCITNGAGRKTLDGFGTWQRLINTDLSRTEPGQNHELLAQALEQALAQGEPGKQLYVLYNDGSHTPYYYPKSAERFTPASCNTANLLAKIDETCNAYDNTIVDFDAAAQQIITSLKDRNAIYFYCSDHGEALGEDGYVNHAWAIPSVVTPAIFIWYSDSFAQQHPEMVAALHANQNKAISHDHIFHTVLSLGSIKSEVIKEELDLTNPEAKETPPPANLQILNTRPEAIPAQQHSRGE